MKNNALKRTHQQANKLTASSPNKRVKTEIPQVVNSTEKGFTGSPKQWFDGKLYC